MARSDQDYVTQFSDTVLRGVPGLLPDYLSRKKHTPLGLVITQRSMAWSNSLVDDFVLIEYTIQNAGKFDLRRCWVGQFMEPAFGPIRSWEISGDTVSYVPSPDEACGFLHSYQSDDYCHFYDTINMVWAADTDGDPDYLSYQWTSSGPYRSHMEASGLRILESPKTANGLHFNWWLSPGWTPYIELNYGPRFRPPSGQMPRDFRTGGTGHPDGDANKYYVMSNGEIDFDSPRTPLILPDNPIWEYPNQTVRLFLKYGAALGYVLSTGPFDILRGEEVRFVVAYIGGENFHVDPENGLRSSNGDVDGWYANVDFSDLVRNAKQAEWVYDNPGYDTDGDGYRGKFHVCVLDSVLSDSVWVPSIAETTYYAGDGVPDWRAVGPPPAPRFWLYPYDHGIRVRFNGLLSETTKDLVSNRLDFEGYRIYLGRDDREASLAVAAGFDQKNYDKYVWNPKIYPSGGYEVQDTPFTLEQLRCLYGTGETKCTDSFFDPTAFSSANPYRMPGYLLDSLFYFQPHGYNASRLGIDTPIRKIYPDEPKPVPGQPIPPEAYTDDGYLKYYEYECVIENLLPTVPYYVNVTAFDYGDPAGGVEALESSKMLGMQDCFALENANQTGEQDKPAYVYPNPYRTDANYRQQGYEGRGSDRINDRERRIHFANLPAKCWIRVHTLDGDLVREIRHDMDPNDPASDHDTWDLINRNIMAVESGLYYWSVEGDDGKVQIGKLVIIK